jgi:ribosomal protein L21E
MKKVFGTIRKWNFKGNGRYPSSQTNLHKQITTLFKKLIKLDDTVILTYSIEKDQYRGKYHVHVQIEYSDEEALYTLLSEFVQGDWTKSIVDGEKHDDCHGKYGTVHLESGRSYRAALRYMNKFINCDSKTLVKITRE